MCLDTKYDSKGLHIKLDQVCILDVVALNNENLQSSDRERALSDRVMQVVRGDILPLARVGRRQCV